MARKKHEPADCGNSRGLADGSSGELGIHTKGAAVPIVAHPVGLQQSSVSVSRTQDSLCRLEGCDCDGRPVPECWLLLDGAAILGAFGSQREAELEVSRLCGRGAESDPGGERYLVPVIRRHDDLGGVSLLGEQL